MGHTINNYDKSGTTLSTINPTNMFYSRIKDMDTNCDFILLFGGTNDWGLGLHLGDKTDTNQTINWYGTLFVNLALLRRKFPDKTIFINEITQRNWLLTSDKA